MWLVHKALTNDTTDIYNAYGPLSMNNNAIHNTQLCD